MKRPSRWTSEKLIEDLTDAHEQIGWWHGKNPELDEESRARFRDDYGAYEKAVGRAIRAGITHSIVADWIRGRRSVGDREVLRKLRLGLESGMTRAIDLADCWVALESVDLIERGMSLEGIRRTLVKKAATAPNELRVAIARRLHSKQNLQKRLSNLGISTRS